MSGNSHFLCLRNFILSNNCHAIGIYCCKDLSARLSRNIYFLFVKTYSNGLLPKEYRESYPDIFEPKKKKPPKNPICISPKRVPSSCNNVERWGGNLELGPDFTWTLFPNIFLAYSITRLRSKIFAKKIILFLQYYEIIKDEF